MDVGVAKEAEIVTDSKNSLFKTLQRGFRTVPIYRANWLVKLIIAFANL